MCLSFTTTLVEKCFHFFSKTSYYFFLFWTLIAELVIDSISVLARTCPRLAGEDWPHAMRLMGASIAGVIIMH